MRFDRCVALARGIAQTIGIDNLDTAPPAVDEAGPFEGNGDLRSLTRRTPSICDKNTCVTRNVSPSERSRAQEPTRQASLDPVRRVASDRLLGLREKSLLMLNDGVVHRDVAVKCRRAPKDTVATDHGRFHRVPCGKSHDQGNDAAVRKVNVRELRSGDGQDGPLLHFDGPKVRTNPFKVSLRQRRQKLIGGRKGRNIHCALLPKQAGARMISLSPTPRVAAGNDHP